MNFKELAMALFSQVMMVVWEELVVNVRNMFPDTKNCESRVWLPAKKISVMFESRWFIVEVANMERVRQDSPTGH